MAIEIKRTPVLEGEAAQAFARTFSENKITVSEEKVRHAMTEASKILHAFKSKASTTKR